MCMNTHSTSHNTHEHEHWLMFKGPQGMSLAGNAAAAAASAAAAAATSANTAAADKIKMCASSLIWPGGLPNSSTCYQARK